MEETQGLSKAAGGGMDEAKMQELLQQVMQMLQQGTTPEELLQMGVPKEIIDYAIQMLQQQGGVQQAPAGAAEQQAMAAEQQPQGGGLSRMGA